MKERPAETSRGDFAEKICRGEIEKRFVQLSL